MISLCSACGTVVRVLGDSQQVELLVGSRSQFWPDRYVCPKCDGAAVGCEQPTAEMLSGVPGETLFELSAEEALALHMGLGVPSERRVSVELLDETLREHVVQWGLGIDVSSGRVYINWLETKAGTRVFLGAGPCGAVAYRVKPKQRYAERIGDEL